MTKDPFEESGYEAGINGKRLEESSLWAEAWRMSGKNPSALVIAGWIAGRAVRRFRQETGGQDV